MHTHAQKKYYVFTFMVIDVSISGLRIKNIFSFCGVLLRENKGKLTLFSGQLVNNPFAIMQTN